MLFHYRHIARQLIGVGLASGTLVLSTGSAKAALVVTPSTDAAAMAAALIGPGVQLVPGSATYAGAGRASGFFSGDTTIFGNPAGANGILLTSGDVDNALAPNDSTEKTTANQLPGNSDLDSLIGTQTTRDASTLTFRITLNPGTSGLQWNYVFGSEEYNEFVGSQFNDVFALTLEGTNLALIPSSTKPVTINSVNNGLNSAFFRDNTSGTIATQYDGLTTVLTAKATGLKPGVEYTLSFAIADNFDFSVDSGVFLLAGSIKDPGNDAVPGPLPLLAAGAAFAWSRRLRSRISGVTPVRPR